MNIENDNEKFITFLKRINEDRCLDYRCKGLLCTMLTLDGYAWSMPVLIELVTPRDEKGHMIEEFKGEGKSAIASALQKLEKLGYLQRVRCKTADGKFNGVSYKLKPVTG